MKAITEKQILEWKEELGRQVKTRDHAKKVLDESNININTLQGGIQFGEMLLQTERVRSPTIRYSGAKPTIRKSTIKEIGAKALINASLIMFQKIR